MDFITFSDFINAAKHTHTHALTHLANLWSNLYITLVLTPLAHEMKYWWIRGDLNSRYFGSQPNIISRLDYGSVN